MLITLTTDFGYRDSFAGILKGVIQRINPKASVVDLTHGIPPQDIMAAALTLRHSIQYFPDGTVHVVVVDPGVGGARRPLLVQSADNFFIGPDNGVLSLAVSGKNNHIVELTNSAYHLKPTGTTFHGRDLFAPVAAYLSLGVPIDSFGPFLSSYVKLSEPQVKRHQASLEGEIIYIDGYGNLFTNIYERDLTGLSQVKVSMAVGPIRIQSVVSSYDAVQPHALAAVINSWGVLEIGEYKGSAQLKCNAKIGDKVIVSWNV